MSELSVVDAAAVRAARVGQRARATWRKLGENVTEEGLLYRDTGDLRLVGRVVRWITNEPVEDLVSFTVLPDVAAPDVARSDGWLVPKVPYDAGQFESDADMLNVRRHLVPSGLRSIAAQLLARADALEAQPDDFGPWEPGDLVRTADGWDFQWEEGNGYAAWRALKGGSLVRDSGLKRPLRRFILADAQESDVEATP